MSVGRLEDNKVRCPVCDQPCVDPPLARYNAAKAAAHFCPAPVDWQRHRELTRCICGLWAGDEAAVYRCAECGFGFGWPFVGGDEEFYRLCHEQGIGYPTWRWEYGLTYDWVTFQGTVGKALDIGAGIGAFLCGLPAAWQKYATEGSPHTRSILRDRGILVFHDGAEALREGPGTFQLITVFQVLEHLSSFRNVLRECRDLLAADGSLVISVPHADRTFRQEAITGCADMIPNHVNKWTPRALELAILDAGLKVVRTSVQPSHWRHATYRAGLKVQAHAADESSLSAKAFALKPGFVRLTALRMLTLLALLSLSRWGGEIAVGGSFAMIAERAARGPDPGE